MKNFWRIARSLCLLSVIGACGLFFLNALAVIAASFGYTRPFRYFQYLRGPYWSVIIPALGILALLPLALRKALTRKSAPEEEEAVETADWRRTINSWRSGLHSGPRELKRLAYVEIDRRRKLFIVRFTFVISHRRSRRPPEA
jgi:hypothetical protein